MFALRRHYCVCVPLCEAFIIVWRITTDLCKFAPEYCSCAAQTHTRSLKIMINLLSKISFSLRQKQCTALRCRRKGKQIARKKWIKLKTVVATAHLSQSCSYHMFFESLVHCFANEGSSANKLIAGSKQIKCSTRKLNTHAHIRHIHNCVGCKTFNVCTLSFITVTAD